MRSIGSAASVIFLTLASFASSSLEAREKLPHKTAITMQEEHGESELSLYEIATKIIVSSPRQKEFGQLLNDLQDHDADDRAKKFPSDIDLITRPCGRTQSAIQMEIESVVCSPNSSAYEEVSASTFFMKNDIFSHTPEEIDGYFAEVAAPTLASFGDLAVAHGFRRRPLATAIENIGHLPNPYTLSAFVDDEARLLLIKHERIPQIGKATGSPAVISVSLISPAQNGR